MQKVALSVGYEAEIVEGRVVPGFPSRPYKEQLVAIEVVDALGGAWSGSA